MVASGLGRCPGRVKWFCEGVDALRNAVCGIRSFCYATGLGWLRLCGRRARLVIVRMRRRGTEHCATAASAGGFYDVALGVVGKRAGRRDECADHGVGERAERIQRQRAGEPGEFAGGDQQSAGEPICGERRANGDRNFWGWSVGGEGGNSV